jgi:hypothetical protein
VDIRGRGLLVGVELGPTEQGLLNKVLAGVTRAVSQQMFGRLLARARHRRPARVFAVERPSSSPSKAVSRYCVLTPSTPLRRSVAATCPCSSPMWRVDDAFAPGVYQAGVAQIGR